MALGSRSDQRISRAQRTQVTWDMISLDSLLPEDHRARQVWAYIEGCDLSRLYDKIQTFSHSSGRAPIDPAILMTLWLYATLEGVSSARLLERLCVSDMAYRWICGGVSVNYHTLADFRVETGELLDDLLTRSMAALVAAQIVDLSCLAVDGVRVRANAGASSFRSQPRLDALHELAEKKVQELKAQLASDPAGDTKRKQERDLRAQQERQLRIEAAQKAAEAIAAERLQEAKKQRRLKPKNTNPPRASTTDDQARTMCMADGGYRPAYNLQFKTDPTSGCVVGLEVTNKASDMGQLVPCIAEIEQRYQAVPQRLLADGGYASKDDIEALHQKNVDVFCPLPGTKNKIGPSPQPKQTDTPGVIAWFGRMTTPEGARIYANRLQCERPHADVRNRGLTRLLVRGIDKVKAVALWHVIAYNFLQIGRLMPQMA